MKAEATASSLDFIGGPEPDRIQTVRRQFHGPSFAKVLDGRKQPIRGLWQRNGRYYAQLRIENPSNGIKKTRRIPLVNKDNKPVQTVAEAKAELARLQTQRTDNTLPVLTRQQKFADYVKEYLAVISSGTRAKKASTVEKETGILNRWCESIGQLRLNQIKRIHVNRFIDARLKEEIFPRTINLDVIGLRGVMKRAHSEDLIQRLPTDGLRPLKTITSKRPLFTTFELDELCKAAFGTKQTESGKVIAVTENAQEFVDYVRFMAYSGTRRNEALAMQWSDVDFENSQLHVRRQIARQGFASLKSGEERVVDFNPKIRIHLLEMKSRNHAVSDWLFPSPQRGDKDAPAKSFRESLQYAKDKAKLPRLGFHDCRHHFISMCVMSGVDFMTIAAWVGHKDGGVLIGKVYGHLANEHRKAMAQRVNFSPCANGIDATTKS